MLEATGYEGGGCVEVLPSDAAPPNADWTQYCLGLCGCKDGGDTFQGVACEAEDWVVVTPEPPAFDVGAVQAAYLSECAASIAVDELFCEEVRIRKMSGEGDTLYVPTALKGRDAARAAAICNQLAIGHFDPRGNDFGYTVIAIVKRNGGELFQGRGVSCRTTEP
jgi:hypothetical protein